MIDSLTACLAGMDVDLIRSDAAMHLRIARYCKHLRMLHRHFAHLNKSGGIRDSSSFEANVSEVVKLARQEQNSNTDEYIFEWTKSRSGLAGKHFLKRDSTSYGWFYKGPIAGGVDNMEDLVNAINNRASERFDRRKAARAIGLSSRLVLLVACWSGSSPRIDHQLVGTGS